MPQAWVLEPPCSESSLSEHDGFEKVDSAPQVPSGSSPVRWRRWLQCPFLGLVLRTHSSAHGPQNRGDWIVPVGWLRKSSPSG